MNMETGAARAASIHYTAPLAWGVLEQFCFDLERITTIGRYPTFNNSASRPVAQALELLTFMDSKWFDFWVGAVSFPWTRYLSRPVEQYRVDLLQMVPGYDDRRCINGKK